MKKQFVWSFIGTFVVMIAALVLVLAACSKKDESTQQPVNSGILKVDNPQNTCPPGAVYTLWGGQTLNWGTVEVWIDQDNLYIQYQVNESIPYLSISQIHIWIGTTANGFPKNSQGVPIPGQFPINITFNQTVTEYLVTKPVIEIPLTCGAPFYIMAHAVMSDGITTQTAWGGVDGCLQIVKKAKPNDSGRWYYEIGLCGDLTYPCECEGPPDLICTGYKDETAYAGDLAGFASTTKAWWKYYETSTGGVQTLWAGQNLNAGTVEYTSDNNGTITIILGGDWELDPNSTEPVKWEGYNILPSARPTPGQMANKPNPVPIDETGKIITLTGVNDQNGVYWTYYVIHLDVRICLHWVVQ